MGRTDWVILDTETTGLGSTDVVIQIGVTDHRGVTLVDTLVRPAVAIGSGAQAVHGISAEAVAGARDFPAVLPELRRAMAGKTVVAYNAPFDRRLLDQTASRHRVALPAVEWDCAMQWYTRFLGVRSAKLPGAIHGATGDCLATLAVIRTMAGCSGGEAVMPAVTAVLPTPAPHAVIPPPAVLDPRKWTVVAGKPGGGRGAIGRGVGEFDHPEAIAVGADGTVWVAEQGNHRIQMRDPGGTWTVKGGKPFDDDSEWAGGTGTGEFNHPSGIAVGDDGAVWVTDSANHRIQVRDADGNWKVVAGKPGAYRDGRGTGTGEFNHPYGIAVIADGAVLVVDAMNHRIQVRDPDGNWKVVAENHQDWVRNIDDPRFTEPSGIAVGDNGAVWVTDSSNNSVVLLHPDRLVGYNRWGKPTDNGIYSHPDDCTVGTGTGEFSNPTGIAVGADGAVWVTDEGNHRIQVFMPASVRNRGEYGRRGTWSVVAGKSGGGESARGIGPGEFSMPRGIAVGVDGTVWVVDTGNHRIQRFGVG